MTGNGRGWRSGLLLGMAAILVVAGLCSVGFYVFQALAVMGRADQSTTFWLLPFLLFGLASAGIGTVFFVLWLLLSGDDGHGARRQGPDSTD